MDWYCSVWNSDSVSSAVGAQVLFDMLCQGDTSLVGDIELIDHFYDEVSLEKTSLEISKGKGFIIIGCNFEDAEYINEIIPKMAKKHGLSYFEPQNMNYEF